MQVLFVFHLRSAPPHRPDDDQPHLRPPTSGRTQTPFRHRAANSPGPGGRQQQGQEQQAGARTSESSCSSGYAGISNLHASVKDFVVFAKGSTPVELVLSVAVAASLPQLPPPPRPPLPLPPPRPPPPLPSSSPSSGCAGRCSSWIPAPATAAFA